MATSISPYGYDLSMLAAVNAVYPKETEPSTPHASTTLSHNVASILPEGGCPFLQLPYEIRSQIVSYILPCTIPSRTKTVIWLRGHTAIFSTCHALYEECTGLMYSFATFLIDIHFDRIIFNYQWLIATDPLDARFTYGQNLRPEHSSLSCKHDLIPSQKIEFLSKFSPRLRQIMRKFILRIYVVDGYEGMIKYNTANEEVLIMGMLERLEQFHHETGMRESKERAQGFRYNIQGPVAMMKRLEERLRTCLNEVVAD